MAPDKLTGAEIATHNNDTSCWVIIHGRAYDVTDFLPSHPGGPKIILKYAGRDATSEFDPIHPPDTLDKYLDASNHLGPVDMSTVEAAADALSAADAAEEKSRQDRIRRIPPLDTCFNLTDFEAVARHVMKRTAWSYYSSGADDELTMRENRRAFQKIWFRPRVLVDVAEIDLRTRMLGTEVSAPFYVTATALGKLGHAEGEVVLTRAARREGVVQMIPTLASCSFDEIVDAAKGDQVQWLQLYVNQDREVTKRIVQHAEKRGCKALFITVDAPQLGRREKDMREKFSDDGSNVQSSSSSSSDDETPQSKKKKAVDRTQGAARAISSFIDPSLSWADIPWFRSITSMPLVLKGIQRSDDALRAAALGIDALVLSNHGGRQLDTARTGIEILSEVAPALRRAGYPPSKPELYVDGGVRRGSDVLKAVCLGARGVGIGRPFLYAMGAYGEEGVVRAMELLREEMVMDMRLVGARNVEELSADLVDVQGLGARGGDVPRDVMADVVYDPLTAPREKSVEDDSGGGGRDVKAKL